MQFNYFCVLRFFWRFYFGPPVLVSSFWCRLCSVLKHIDRFIKQILHIYVLMVFCVGVCIVYLGPDLIRSFILFSDLIILVFNLSNFTQIYLHITNAILGPVVLQLLIQSLCGIPIRLNSWVFNILNILAFRGFYLWLAAVHSLKPIEIGWWWSLHRSWMGVSAS